MTKYQKGKHIEAIQKFLIKDGWEKDRWENFKKSSGEKEYRIKFNANSVRFELKSLSGWLRIKSSFYKDVVLTENYIKIENAIIGEDPTREHRHEKGFVRRYL